LVIHFTRPFLATPILNPGYAYGALSLSFLLLLLLLDGYENEPTCGRPLGMRLDADGYLIVCDTALGIFKINVATGMCTALDGSVILFASVQMS